jgi:hypothetical protein
MPFYKVPFEPGGLLGPRAVLPKGSFAFNSTTRLFHKHDGATPGGVPCSASLYDGTGSLKTPGDSVNVADFGAVSYVNASVAFDMAAAYAVSIGATKLRVDDDFDITGAAQDIYKLQFVGKGSVTGKYKKRVIREHDPVAQLSITLDADLHLPAFKAAGIPTVTMVGDSWMSGFYFGASKADSQFEIISDYIRKRTGRQKINFVNRGVGGLRFTDLGRDAVVAIDSTAYPWATAATPYMDLVKATNPDLVVVSFGMNDSGGWDVGSFPQKDFWSIISKIRNFPSRPDIVFVTSGNKSISTSDTTYSSDYAQKGTDAVAGYVRAMCEMAGIGYLDVNRQMGILRDGLDVGDIYRKQYSYTNQTIPFTSPVECFDYSFQINIPSTDATAFSSYLKFPLSPLVSKNFLYIQDVSGELWVVAYRDSSGTFAIKYNTGIATPSLGSDVTIYFNLSGSTCQLRLSTDGGFVWSDLYNGPIFRFGGSFAPVIEYTDFHTGQPGTVTFCAGIPREVKPGANDAAMYVTNEGGNGINHPTPRFVRALFDPVCAVQRWSGQPFLPVRGAFAAQMLRGYDGLAIDFANKDFCIKSSLSPELNQAGLPHAIMVWEAGSALDYVIDGGTGRCIGARFTANLPSIALSLLPFNVAEGTLLVEAYQETASGHSTLASITRAGTTGPRLMSRIYDNTTYRGTRITVVDDASATVCDGGSPSAWPVVDGRFSRHCFAWKNNSFVGMFDGNYNTGHFDYIGTVPTSMTKLRIGHVDTAAQSPGCVIRRLIYIPKALDMLSLVRLGLV